MHDDLRRRALESGKKVSRKARSRQSSQPSSRVNSPSRSKQPSRAGSRVGSRVNSDDEGSSESDESILGTNLEEAGDENEDLYVQNFETIVENLLDRDTRRQNNSAREDNLQAYGQCLKVRYDGIDIETHEKELIRSFLRSVKKEATEKEAVLALNALSLTFVTSMPSEDIFEEVVEALKKSITDSMCMPIKAAAIHALGITTFYSGFGEEEVTETRAFLLDIVSSDGGSIDALDIEAPVVAAIQEYGFLATLVKDETRQEGDFAEESQDAVTAFVDQLSSMNPDVQIAAGECIALLYEMAYTPIEAGEKPDNSGNEANFVIKRLDPSAKYGTNQFIKRYSTYRQTDQLEAQLEELPTLNRYSNSRKKKKELRSNLADILNSIQNPTHGPHYSNAMNYMTGQAYGSRLRVKVGVYAGRQAGLITIDRWSSLFHFQGLQRVLKGFFSQHVQTNNRVSDLFQIKWDED